MRKILSSILMIATAAILVSLGTFAYFSDTESNSQRPYTAASGTIDIEVGWPEQPAGEFTLADLKPSQVRYLTETVRNVGKNPAVIWKMTHVTNVTDGEVVGPEKHEGTGADGVYVPRFNIHESILYDLKIKITKTDGTTQETVIIRDPADGETGLTLYQIDFRFIKLGVLGPGETMEVTQSYHMRKSTTNWAQADAITFIMLFAATQTNDNTARPNTSIPPSPRGEWSVDSFFDIYTEL